MGCTRRHRFARGELASSHPVPDNCRSKTRSSLEDAGRDADHQAQCNVRQLNGIWESCSVFVMYNYMQGNRSLFVFAEGNRRQRGSRVARSNFVENLVLSRTCKRAGHTLRHCITLKQLRNPAAAPMQSNGHAPRPMHTPALTHRGQWVCSRSRPGIPKCPSIQIYHCAAE